MKKWKTKLALILMAFAIVFNWGWFWAVFILLGIIHVIRSGKIHFVESVDKEENPRLFWTMVVIWSLLALYSIISYLDILT
jgi:D-alanyl-lipoteichoic acid acyltransferase DltB (MBOAT superfamily)